jgi:hypothetical protein
MGIKNVDRARVIAWVVWFRGQAIDAAIAFATDALETL